jgi:hypothetical protein
MRPVTYRAFTRSCPSHDGNPLPSLKFQVDILQDIGTVFIVTNSDVAKLNRSRPRPAHGEFPTNEFASVQNRGFRDCVGLLLGLDRNELDDTLELSPISIRDKTTLTNCDSTYPLKLNLQLVQAPHQVQDRVAQPRHIRERKSHQSRSQRAGL